MSSITLGGALNAASVFKNARRVRRAKTSTAVHIPHEQHSALWLQCMDSWEKFVFRIWASSSPWNPQLQPLAMREYRN
ncbi:hypothetical protein HMPREF1544_00921 [Mucor circinelloides 1006PhL]|uniref:Uncharacterized protein n=1 Tax=Mucor circinelloides f. circinelloides (strain 1006PhL) TaxID=1220926 RepID=S2JVB7_MUCC1|nr:hypothetical protein HMPREF1544_00921 [Mucor circinelloides 1006PhL]KAG1110126.1 hypothetical protein G6F42_015433 [Rhizopus arrhizus]